MKKKEEFYDEEARLEEGKIRGKAIPYYLKSFTVDLVAGPAVKSSVRFYGTASQDENDLSDLVAVDIPIHNFMECVEAVMRAAPILKAHLDRKLLTK